MPHLAQPLTETAIRDAVAGRGPRRLPLYDGYGLHLVERRDRRYWRLKYRRPDGRENRLALGVWPEVSLAEARDLALEARAKLRHGIDPAGEREAAREAAAAARWTFARMAQHWLEVKESGWSPITLRKNTRAVTHYLLPQLGRLDVATIATKDVLPVVRDTDQHSPEYARAAAQAAQGIIRLAIAEGHRAEGHLLDLDLRHNLPKRERGHMAAATTPVALEGVLQTIHGIGSPVTRAGLLLCCYLGQRPGNIVGMRWDQIDVQTAEWMLPADQMKTRHEHVVPLPTQALALLDELRPLTGGVGYVFPPLARQGNQHLTRDTLSKALRDAGLRGKQTPHGLRATLRTVARERLGASADVLEAQLAHAKRGQVAAAYDRTGFVKERHTVMQAWADYLDELAGVVAKPKAGKGRGRTKGRTTRKA